MLLLMMMIMMSSISLLLNKTLSSEYVSYASPVTEQFNIDLVEVLKESFQIRMQNHYAMLYPVFLTLSSLASTSSIMFQAIFDLYISHPLIY